MTESGSSLSACPMPTRWGSRKRASMIGAVMALQLGAYHSSFALWFLFYEDKFRRGNTDYLFWMGATLLFPVPIPVVNWFFQGFAFVRIGESIERTNQRLYARLSPYVKALAFGLAVYTLLGPFSAWCVTHEPGEGTPDLSTLPWTTLLQEVARRLAYGGPLHMFAASLLLGGALSVIWGLAVRLLGRHQHTKDLQQTQ